MLGKTFDHVTRDLESALPAGSTGSNGGAGGGQRDAVKDRRKYKRSRAQSLFHTAFIPILDDPTENSAQQQPLVAPAAVGPGSSASFDLDESSKLHRHHSASEPSREVAQLNRRLSQLPGGGIIHGTGNNTIREGSSSIGDRDGERKVTQKKIEVHAYTEDPTTAWEMLKAKRPCKLVRPMKLGTPVKEDAVRFVCLADLHSRAVDPKSIPPGDILLVAGDFSTIGHPHEVKSFGKFLGNLPHTYKIVIAGNHECTFDPAFMKSSGLDRLIGGGSSKEDQLRGALSDAMTSMKVSEPRSLLSQNGVIYLEDSGVDLFGLTIYGTPWQPKSDGWAFNLPRGHELLSKWALIPSGVDVLLTHTPPLGHGDLTGNGVRAGCTELLNSVCSRIRPKYHIYGHIHDGYGCTTDGYTKFINACICDTKMRPNNQPIIFDLALPPGISKRHQNNITTTNNNNNNSGPLRSTRRSS